MSFSRILYGKALECGNMLAIKNMFFPSGFCKTPNAKADKERDTQGHKKESNLKRVARREMQIQNQGLKKIKQRKTSG